MLLALAMSAPAHAVPQFLFQAIDLQTQINGVEVWRYDYTVNGAAFAAGESFEIYFPSAQYQDLVPIAVPEGWSSFVVIGSISVGFDDSGFAAIADHDDIGLTRSFSVEFGWIGSGAPEVQRFDLFDVDFNVVASGNTVMAESTVPEQNVPEPSSGLLIVAAALAALSLRRPQQARGART
jgi:hypothetical protein